MKKLAAAVISTMLVTVSTLSYADTLNSMNKDQVEQAFVNKTSTSIPVIHSKGRPVANTISIFLDDKGNIFGKMAHKMANEPQTDKGVYTIKDDGTYYLTWQHWDDSKQFCVHFFNTKTAYVVISCTNVFHTAFMKDSFQSGNQLK
jgi:hypothetical protein